MPRTYEMLFEISREVYKLKYGIEDFTDEEAVQLIALEAAARALLNLDDKKIPVEQTIREIKAQASAGYTRLKS